MAVVTRREDARDAPEDDGLPVVRAHDLPKMAAGAKWLVHDIWGQQSVGVIAGSPKCAKSWLGLDIAISVASRTPCLGRFAIDDPGPTMVYLAEDQLPEVRERIDGICAHRRLSFEALDVHVITSAAIRLDLAQDQKRLDVTLARHKPKFLLLDPLVRLHRLDENSSADISALLGFLRELQRRYQMAIALVHHMSKRSRAQLGQALRGSSDLHAFGDDFAYLTRTTGKLHLTLEHRSAAATDPMEVRLVDPAPGGGEAHLEVAGAGGNEPPRSLRDDVLAALAGGGGPVQRADLRARLRVANHKLGDVLLALEKERRVTRSGDGWALARNS